MKINLKSAQTLLKLLGRETIAYSRIRNGFIDELLRENILQISGKHHKKVSLASAQQLHTYLLNQYNINDIHAYAAAVLNQETGRAEFTRIAGDSKLSKERAFKGFMVNSYQPVSAVLNNQELDIFPQEGSFVFIYDFEGFSIPAHITVVGVENPLNFRHISEQSYLFDDIVPLFISRYPQTQSKDFIKWLKRIPNQYLHFGDFDYAGINIYLLEYKKYIGDRARFFVPDDIAANIKDGSRKRFDMQKLLVKKNAAVEPDIKQLISLIEKEQKGLDQEFYIRSKSPQK